MPAETPLRKGRAETRWTRWGAEKRAQETDNNVCAICLDEFKSPALARSCFHAFCFECITEWIRSSRRALCPLCKRPFEQLVFDVKSQDDFQVVNVDDLAPAPAPGPVPPGQVAGRGQVSFDGRALAQSASQRPRAARSAYHERLRRLADARRRGRIRAVQTRASDSFPLSHSHATVASRRSYYLQRQGTSPNTQRVSAEQADLLRLEPFLVRELRAATGDSDVEVLVHYILAMAERFPIGSGEMRERLHGFLSGMTDVFMSEMSRFVLSRADLETYDRLLYYREQAPSTGFWSTQAVALRAEEEDAPASTSSPALTSSAPTAVAEPTRSAQLDDEFQEWTDAWREEERSILARGEELRQCQQRMHSEIRNLRAERSRIMSLLDRFASQEVEDAKTKLSRSLAKRRAKRRRRRRHEHRHGGGHS